MTASFASPLEVELSWHWCVDMGPRLHCAGQISEGREVMGEERAGQDGTTRHDCPRSHSAVLRVLSKRSIKRGGCTRRPRAADTPTYVMYQIANLMRSAPHRSLVNTGPSYFAPLGISFNRHRQLVDKPLYLPRPGPDLLPYNHQPAKLSRYELIDLPNFSLLACSSASISLPSAIFS